jgi:hypothetical protein
MWGEAPARGRKHAGPWDYGDRSTVTARGVRLADRTPQLRADSPDSGAAARFKVRDPIVDGHRGCYYVIYLGLLTCIK